MGDADSERRAADGSDDASTRRSRLVARPLVALLAGGTICLIGLVVGARLLASSLAVEVVLVPAVGLLALAIGLGWIDGQFGGAVDGTTPPRVERPAVDVPGTDVDAALRTEHATRASYAERMAVKRRLRRLAVAGLTSTGLTETQAQRRLDEATWTDDDPPASFFAFDADGPGWLSTQYRRLKRRIRGVLGRQSRFGRGARHTIDATAHRLGVTERSWGDPTSPADLDARAVDQPGRITDLTERQVATNRFRIVAGLVLAAVGLGVLLWQPTLVLAGAVGTSLLAHRYAGGVPEPKLQIERTVEADDPDHGDAIPVTVTVENVGDETVYDLRLFDGVPPALSVAEGSPRQYTGLQPGASTTISYDLLVESGRHDFDPVGVVARSASGAVERTITVDADGDTTVTCQPRPTPDIGTPIRSQTRRDIGSVVTTTGGAGIEFHSVREYRSGDPLRRIDWHRLARDGELATLQFAVERSTTVVLVIDTRREAFVSHDRDGPTAVDRSIDAAASTVYELAAGNDKVGLATIGPHNCWIPPRSGRDQWPITADALASQAAFDYPDPDDRFLSLSTLHWLRTRLPANAQVVFFSPMTDDMALRLARRLQACGYPPAVVSPQATDTATPGRLVAHLERRLRLSRLRSAGLTTVDWRSDEPIEAAFERLQGRESR